jgi:hypothetical protein
MSEVNGRTNEDLYATRDLYEDEAQRSNRYSGSFVATVRSRPRLSKMLDLLAVYFSLIMVSDESTAHSLFNN